MASRYLSNINRTSYLMLEACSDVEHARKWSELESGACSKWSVLEVEHARNWSMLESGACSKAEHARKWSMLEVEQKYKRR